MDYLYPQRNFLLLGDKERGGGLLIFNFPYYGLLVLSYFSPSFQVKEIFIYCHYTLQPRSSSHGSGMGVLMH